MLPNGGSAAWWKAGRLSLKAGAEAQINGGKFLDEPGL
jgi:hypothetical protein